jgi:hypothetical protein
MATYAEIPEGTTATLVNTGKQFTMEHEVTPCTVNGTTVSILGGHVTVALQDVTIVY